MKKRVFVSSTIYDLVDVRAEIEAYIRNLGLDPVLSDSATSDFVVFPDRNSIETCLVNVRRSDYIVVILSRRYGPSLAKVGYDDLSATHLEYRCARDNKIPILFYARDRLLSEYNIWLTHRDGPFYWLEKDKDRRLFEFIDEHKRLIINTCQSNWCDSFASIRDLRMLLARDLRGPSAYALLDRAIRDNKIPMFDGDVKAEFNNPSPGKVFARFLFENVGTVPAYNVIFQWHPNVLVSSSVTPVVAPARHIFQEVTFDALMLKCDVSLSYQSPEGHGIIDTFHAVVGATWGSITTRVTLVKRIFKPGDALPLCINNT